jgi:hypothetical protein
MPRLPDDAHAALPWRIHAIIPDLGIEDVWALPAQGGRDDFPALVTAVTKGNLVEASPRLVRLLWAARWRLGSVLGWDRPGGGLGARVASLRDRLPADLAAVAPEPLAVGPFIPLYQLPDEWAGEIANETVHAVLHLGWVPDGTGGYRGQMAVLVRPNGGLGRLYMAAIKPIRHAVIYPALLRQIDRVWTARQ